MISVDPGALALGFAVWFVISTWIGYMIGIQQMNRCIRRTEETRRRELQAWVDAEWQRRLEADGSL